MVDGQKEFNGVRIVIDARLWSESGLGRYIRNLITNLQQIDKTNEYIILLIQKDFENLNFEGNFSKKLVDIRWYSFQEQLQLPKILNDLKPDLVHFPHFNIPILYSGKYVVTIHDLIHQHFKTREVTTRNPFYFRFKQIAYHQAFSKALKNSQKIITPTNFVKDQLISEWKVDSSKIEVTPEGVDDSILKKINNKQLTMNKLTNKFGITRPYLFYVGNAQPHKNLSFLIESFLEIKDQFPDLQLVLSGPQHLFWDKLKQQIFSLHSKNTDDIIFTRFVSEEEMVSLYKNSEAFILPSLEEGFGIPILEAMACKTAVLASDIGSLKEVGGEAALYFDPRNKEDLKQNLVKILKNQKLRDELVNKGIKRYQQFSWHKMAQQTHLIYF